MLAAPLLSLASVGLGAAGSIMGAEGQAAADKYQAEMLNREAEYGRLSATQTNAALSRNLAETLGKIDAVRMASHDSPSSPTGSEVRNQAGYLGDEQKGIKVSNILAQSQLDDSQAAYLRSAASAAMTAGYLGAGADIFKGLGGLVGGGGGGLFGGS